MVSMAELKKNLGMKTGVRHALTIPQQRAFMEYIATHPIYYHWWPIFTVFLGTGCRIGEVLGLRWEDINYEKRIICVNHNLTYYPVGEDRAIRKSYFNAENRSRYAYNSHVGHSEGCF